MSHPKLVFVLATTLILISLLCRAVPATSAASGRSALEMREQEQIDAYIQARMQAAHIPGLALGVVRGDQVVYLKGYGIAGPDRRSVTPQTPFILGSTSKSFTALAIMQLVEAGKIDLDAPVKHYLPWFRTADEAASARITVRSLLNQDSGLPVYEGLEGLSENDQIRCSSWSCGLWDGISSSDAGSAVVNCRCAECDVSGTMSCHSALIFAWPPWPG
jgi:CubicO group peptidase (beta-lactamase class C family)